MKNLRLLLFFFFLFFFSITLFAGLVYAQDATSNCVFTKIGTLPSGYSPTPPPGCPQPTTGETGGGGSSSTNNFAILAYDLVQSVNKNCTNTKISQDNYECLTSNIPSSATYSDAASSEITTNLFTARNYYYQCVGFANTVTAGINNADKGLREADNEGTAAEYMGSNSGGYHFVSVQDIKNGAANFQEGDMPVWDSALAYSGGDGHIAVVIQKLDSQNFVIAQANGDGMGTVNTRPAILTEKDLAGFLHYNGN